MNRAEQHAFLLTTRTPGFPVLLKVLKRLVAEAEQDTFACEDPAKLVLLAQQARGAREVVRKFELEAQTAQIPQESETGSDWTQES